MKEETYLLKPKKVLDFDGETRISVKALKETKVEEHEEVQ